MLSRIARGIGLGVLACACVGPPGPPVASAPEPVSTAQLEKEARLREAHERGAVSRHPYLSRTILDELDRARAERLDEPDLKRRVGATLGVAHYSMMVGELDRSIELYESCAAEIIGDERFSNRETAAVLYGLGMSWFRHAERTNCIANHNSSSCIFPFAEAAVHVNREGAERAARNFERTLELEPTFREAQWLMNLAHMALGDFPQGVPVRYLYPYDRLRSESSAPRFTDVAVERGVLRYTRAGGAIMDDFSGDGRLDLVLSSFETATPLGYYVNVGADGFERRTSEAKLTRQLGGMNMIQGDVDGDGRLDLLVLRGAGLGEQGELECSLLVNVGDQFRDRTAEAGLAIAAATRTAAFADIDLDGDLDLFIGYDVMRAAASDVSPDVSQQGPTGRLFLNDGTGRFDDVTDLSGVAVDGTVMGCAFGDVDGDRRPDLFVSRRHDSNLLFVNQRDGTFRELSEERGVSEPKYSYACWFFDYDNDGDLDLFSAFTGYGLRTRHLAEYYWSGTVGDDTQRLFENDGSGHFRDVTRERGLHRIAYSLGANFGDIDGDGWLDVYLGTGSDSMSSLWPNVLYKNERGERFLDVTEAAGVGHLQKGHGIAFGDIDLDGDQDILLQVGGYHLDDGFGDVVFENEGGDHRWLAIDLVGVQSNRMGVGARIRVRIREQGAERDVYAFVGATSSFGGSSLRAELGLGNAEEIVELAIDWPHDGETEHFPNVPLDSLVRIREGAGAVERVQLR